MNSNLSVLKGLKLPLHNVKYLSRLFEENAAKYPDKISVIYRDVSNSIARQMTYEELDNAANCIARTMLKHVELSPNSDGDFVITLILPPSDEFVVIMIAIWKCGATQMPLEKNTPSENLRHMLNETKPVLIITEEEESERDAVYDGYKTISLQRLTAEAKNMLPSLIRDTEMLSSTVQPVAVIFYTSGSTGLPKGARNTHRMLHSRFRWQWQEFPYSSTETVCVVRSTPSFADILEELWVPLLNPEPKSVLILPKDNIVDFQKFIPLLEEYKVERIAVVPSLLRSLLTYLGLSQRKQLMNIKTWISTSETLPIGLARQFFNYFPFGSYKLCNMYGTSEIAEVTFHVITNKDNMCINDKVPVGKPLHNTNVYVLDKKLQPVPVGEIGQICVSGLGISSAYVKGREPECYLKNPLSMDSDYNTIYITGDYGRIVNGVLLYEGRNDSQVKVRGHRVDLIEIDIALSKINGLNNSAVLCYKPGELDQVVLAYVTQYEESDLTEEEIEARLQSLLPSYSIPKVFIIDKIPLTKTEKVDRQGLLKRYAEISEGKTSMENMEIDYSSIPEDKVHAAQCLLRTIALVLAGSVCGKISLESNFYHLGGHSLNTVYAVTKLRDQGYIIGIRDFATADTLLDILIKLKRKNIDDGYMRQIPTNSQARYVTEKLVEAHKHDFIRIITDSFYLKGELQKWINKPAKKEDFEDVFNIAWPKIVAKGRSFVTRSMKTGDIVGVCVNFDVHDQTPIHEHNKNFKDICVFLKYLQDPIIKNKLPQGMGQVMIGSMAGTEKMLPAAENVAVMYFMTDELIKMCKSEGFVGIFTINTSPLTQQLTTDVFNHKALCNCQLNKYVAPDGSRPFSRAPDTERVICSYGEV